MLQTVAHTKRYKYSVKERHHILDRATGIILARFYVALTVLLGVHHCIITTVGNSVSPTRGQLRSCVDVPQEYIFKGLHSWIFIHWQETQAD